MVQPTDAVRVVAVQQEDGRLSGLLGLDLERDWWT